MKTQNDDSAYAADFARWAGLSIRHLCRLSRDGWFKASVNGRYAMPDASLGLIEYFKHQAAQHELANSADGKRKLRAEVELLELKLKRERAKYYPRDVVENFQETVFKRIADRIRAIPDRISLALINAKSQQIAHEIIEQEAFAALTELSEEDGYGLPE